ncbi:unnamed protein product [Amoebophrya sp. A120]|nr:unnamed protein product [Amoebophrya sp. A120]|eukprot:GSA120T00021852001.1
MPNAAEPASWTESFSWFFQEVVGGGGTIGAPASAWYYFSRQGTTTAGAEVASRRSSTLMSNASSSWRSGPHQSGGNRTSGGTTSTQHIFSSSSSSAQKNQNGGAELALGNEDHQQSTYFYDHQQLLQGLSKLEIALKKSSADLQATLAQLKPLVGAVRQEHEATGGRAVAASSANRSSEPPSSTNSTVYTSSDEGLQDLVHFLELVSQVVSSAMSRQKPTSTAAGDGARETQPVGTRTSTGGFSNFIFQQLDHKARGADAENEAALADSLSAIGSLLDLIHSGTSTSMPAQPQDRIDSRQEPPRLVSHRVLEHPDQRIGGGTSGRGEKLDLHEDLESVSVLLESVKLEEALLLAELQKLLTKLQLLAFEYTSGDEAQAAGLGEYHHAAGAHKNFLAHQITNRPQQRALGQQQTTTSSKELNMKKALLCLSKAATSSTATSGTTGSGLVAPGMQHNGAAAVNVDVLPQGKAANSIGGGAPQSSTVDPYYARLIAYANDCRKLLAVDSWQLLSYRVRRYQQRCVTLRTMVKQIRIKILTTK